jgi:hypothetical protein
MPNITELRIENMQIELEIKCGGCGISKASCLFDKRPKSESGFSKICKICTKDRREIRRVKNKALWESVECKPILIDPENGSITYLETLDTNPTPQWPEWIDQYVLQSIITSEYAAQITNGMDRLSDIAPFLGTPETIPDGFKKCRDCPSVLPATKEFFGSYKSSPDGLLYKCRDCYNRKSRKRWYGEKGEEYNRRRRTRAKYPDTYKELLKEPPPTHRVCEGCFINKSLNGFGKFSGKNKDGEQRYQYTCKTCNRDVKKARMAEDPVFAKTVSLRRSLIQKMKWIKKGRGNKKGRHYRYIRDIGGTLPQFKTHIESLFQPGMTWDNHGNGRDDWSIDHIIPISTAKSVEEVYQLSKYKNLQPLWHRDNMLKSNLVAPTGPVASPPIILGN